jgi:hypothetical protein
MTDAEFRAVAYLLERTLALLRARTRIAPADRRASIARLVLEFELLRARTRQPVAQSQRN